LDAKTDDEKLSALEALKKRVVIYAELMKTWFEAFTGKKDIKSKVDVLASPENLKSMSVLSEPQTRFVAISHFLAGVMEWGGLFNGLRDYSDEIMKVSPSKVGLGREQVIRFMGAVEESKLIKGLNLAVGGRGEEGAETEK